MSEILDFWSNKMYYSEEELIPKMTEYYRADFIENYAKWKKHLDDLNEDAIFQLKEVGMPEKFWEPLQYDNFCQNFIDLMEEWIKVNKDITRHNIKVIYQKLFTEFLGKHLKLWEENMYTMDSLMDSIKKTVIIKS